MARFSVLASIYVWQAQGAWYDGIDSITVLTPNSDSRGAQAKVDSIWQEMEQDVHGNSSAFQKGQFGSKRRAVLLTAGDYGNLSIPVNWYTSVIGCGKHPEDVAVQGIVSKDAYPGSSKGALENFWKSAEGVSTKEEITLWAVSQAAPLRRSVIRGDLYLSETDELSTHNGTHYSSGGFLADVTVHGSLKWGSQQQFFFRNSKFNDVNYTTAGQSFVFVGVEGAPTFNTSKPKPLISTIDVAPTVAEKPYLVEQDSVWHIAVPRKENDKSGPSKESWFHDFANLEMIPMDQVFVAKDGDTAAAIQNGIQGKRALLLTPGWYSLKTAIVISRANFVVLGIGMPTLVATHGLSAFVVDSQAHSVRIASVLLEAGTPPSPDATEPLLMWRGDDGFMSDIFARVGAFAYQSDFHQSCSYTQADIMVQVDGRRMTLDNAWLWHADHDDCTTDEELPESDKCDSSTGLLINGDDAVAYGLAVEHTKADLVIWNGENGQLFFFQSELPYRSNLDFGKQGHVGFKVGYGVQRHTNYGVGIYQVFNTYSMDVSFRIPASADVTNMFSWCITGNRSGLGTFACTRPGLDECTTASCDDNSCETLRWLPNQEPDAKSAPRLGQAEAAQCGMQCALGITPECPAGCKCIARQCQPAADTSAMALVI